MVPSDSEVLSLSGMAEKSLIKSVYFTKQLDRETGTKVLGLIVYLTQNNNIKFQDKQPAFFGNFKAKAGWHFQF